MQFDRKGKPIIKQQKYEFPDLINEGKKYGLNEEQLSHLRRYLNDKRMLRLISLQAFSNDVRAWFSALTGIVAEVLAMDTHVSIWLDKKLDKPRNWILSKLNDVIPTKIDDIVIKAMQAAQQFTDDTLLPLKEQLLSRASSKMHDKYDYYNNYTALGLTAKEHKAIAKANLKESKSEAKQALKTLNRRKFETALIRGYHDEDGNFVNLRKYKNPTVTTLLKAVNKKKYEKEQKKENYGTKEEETKQGSTRGLQRKGLAYENENKDWRQTGQENSKGWP